MTYNEYRKAVEDELGHRLEMWEATIVATSYQDGESVAECVVRLQ